METEGSSSWSQNPMTSSPPIQNESRSRNIQFL
jgi:hypothetical protein